MKKVFIIAVIATLFLTSCSDGSLDPSKTKVDKPQAVTKSQNQSRDATNNDYIKIGTVGVYDMSGDFIKAANNNPIDRAYNTELDKLNSSNKFTTLSALELEVKYTKLWDAELNAIYKKLLPLLNKNEQKLLIESQNGWLEFNTKESEFVNEVFFNRKTGQIFGSWGIVQTQSAKKERIRERALQLMEYYYSLEYKVEFKYKGS